MGHVQSDNTLLYAWSTSNLLFSSLSLETHSSAWPEKWLFMWHLVQRRPLWQSWRGNSLKRPGRDWHKHATCQRKKIGERCVRKRLPNTEKKLPKGCREQVTRRDMAKVRHWPFCTKGKHFQLGWGEQQTLTTTAVRPWKSRKCNEQKTPKGRGSENELDSYKGYWQQEFTSDFEKLSD